MRIASLAFVLAAACTTHVSVDANGDGAVDRMEICTASCSCETDWQAECLMRCADLTDPLWPRSCDAEIAHCVFEERYEGDGCRSGLVGDCHDMVCP